MYEPTFERAFSFQQPRQSHLANISNVNTVLTRTYSMPLVGHSKHLSSDHNFGASISPPVTRAATSITPTTAIPSINVSTNNYNSSQSPPISPGITPSSNSANNLCPDVPRDACSSKIVNLCGNDHFSCTTVRMTGVSPVMEDVACNELTPNRSVFAVFDGHSGIRCAEFLSKNLVSTLINCQTSINEASLESVCTQLDQQFLTNQQTDTSGSTAAFVVTSPTTTIGTHFINVGNVGDARVILISANGDAQLLSQDHKPSSSTEAMRIRQCGGNVEFDRVDGILAVSRAFGDRHFKVGGPGGGTQKVISKPYCTQHMISRGQMLLLSSDGIFCNDKFSVQEIGKLLVDWMKTLAPARALCLLLDEALRRGSTDNMVATIVQISDGRSMPTATIFVPGPYIGVNSPIALNNHRELASTAGIGIDRSLEIRYDSLNRELVRLSQKMDQTSYTQEVIRELKQELLNFQGGPPLSLTGSSRTAWFRSLVNA
eukprot:NODE_1532_length_1915_cov_29.633371_g1299_i0.p1 GENE.NODE_1532_length_1915_cov_29.633371_g1299_i0~~NODE_1532_length_1915_cov_29.633371_g1299_i0.p1  ORF type:complete len:487 (+),score=102.63 NODE_1532_length_1915_cov_29.633371_g1299_i0:102-1562(+)